MIYLAVLIQVIVSLVAKRLLVTWFHPVVVLFLLWSVVLIATAAAAPDYYFSIGAYLILLLFQVFALVGAVIGFLMWEGKWREQKVIQLPYARPLVWFSVALGMLSVIALLRSNGASLNVIMNVDALFDVSRSFSLARYEDDYRMPFVSRISQMVVFFALIISGVKFSADYRGMWRFEFFMPFLPLVLTAIVLTTRATVIFGAIFWLSGYVAGKLWCASTVRAPLLTTKGWFISVASLATFVVMFVFLQFLRGGITDVARLPEVLSHLRKWPFGSLAGFSIWFDQNQGSEIAWGYYTFTGFFDLMGLRARATGLYLDYVDLGGGAFGNIYTAFRGLIEDFTIFGAVGVLLAVGLTSSLAVSMVMRQKVLGLWMLAVTYPIVLFSPIVSFYGYLGHLAASVLAMGYMIVFARTKGHE